MRLKLLNNYAMKKKTAKMPPQIEWDFSKIADDQISSVALYEYALTSDQLRDGITKWLQTKHNGKPLCELLFDALKNRDASKYYPLVNAYQDAGIKAMRNNWALFELIRQLPYFPRPFLFYGVSPLVTKYPLGKDRPKNKTAFSRIRIEPIPKTADRIKDQVAALEKRGSKIDESSFLRMAYGHHYKMDIRWDGMTTNDIVDDFRKWLAIEAKNRPELKQRGKPSQVSPHTLAWLAALRISRAGVSYSDAKTELQAAGENFYHALPIYSDKSGWSDAIAKAENILADLEAGKSIVGL